MTQSQNKPGMAFWAAVMAAVVLLYVASFGPACWLLDSNDPDDGKVVAMIYRPVLLLAKANEDGPIASIIVQYSRLRAGDYWVFYAESGEFCRHKGNIGHYTGPSWHFQ